VADLSDEAAETLRFTAEEDAARLDVLLAELAEAPRSQVRRWIEAGRVTLDGRTCRPSHRVAAGQEIVAQPPEIVSGEALPEAIAIEVVYEDSDLIVVDKPTGMVVHPAPGHETGTLVNALLYHCEDLAGVGGVRRPGIVHRLDKGTSGILVVAKNDATHAGLARQFHDHTIERRYRAFVRAVPGADAGRVDRPIGRHPRDRKRMSVRDGSGREAHTAWQLLRRYPRSGISDLAVLPETGRTHQIRVHLASAGLPILGDPVYGKPRKDGKGFALSRPGLHAELLGFAHPTTGAALRFESELPTDLAELCEALAAAELA
jgi:23S rRNA pseudouridine1911/1915/1917 synthase